MNTVQSSPFAAPSVIHQPSVPSSLICPITQDVMTDPVIDPHGHSFEKEAILTWLKKNAICPLNKQPITPDSLVPNRALKEMIESHQAPHPSHDTKDVPQPSKQKQNDALSIPLLNSAQDLEQKGQLDDAQQLYVIALQFTSKSEDYAHLPRLYEKKGENEQAATAYVILADLQIGEGKQAKSIITLKKSLQLLPDPSVKAKLGHILNNNGHKQEGATLFLELTQEALYNKDPIRALTLCHQAIEAFPGCAETWKTLASLQPADSRTQMLLKGAHEPSMPLKERIELCRMVTIQEPEHLQARLLFLELNQLKMKAKITQLKAASIQVKEKAVETLIPPQAFGKALWATHFGDIGIEPPLPPNIHTILESPCPFWPGKKIKETHLLTLIPATINGAPLTLNKLEELIQNPQQGHKAEYRYYNRDIKNEHGTTPVNQAYWVLMSRDVIPESRRKSYADQQQLVAQHPHYQVPQAIEAAVCILMEFVVSGVRLYGHRPLTYTRCEQSFQGYQLIVGGLDAVGLIVYSAYVDNDYTGVGALRKF